MIQRRGKSWRVVVYAGHDHRTGRERRITRTVHGTKTDAKRVERKLQVEVSAGKHLTPNVTVADTLDAWLAHVRADLSPTTVATYDGYIDRILRPELGKIRLGKFTTASLDRLYGRLRASGGHNGQPLSPATIRQVHAILRRALRQAQRWGWIEKNPAELATLPPARRRSSTVPSTAEIRVLLEAAEGAEEGLALAIWLAAVTGIRRGELCGLRWTALDLEARSLTVERTVVDIAGKLTVKPPKTDRTRTVAIDAASVAMLTEHRAKMAERALACGAGLHPDAYVLSESPDGSAPLHPNLVSDRFRRLARRNGVRCRLHDLRHAHITELVRAGIPIPNIAARAGHASAKMTLDVYGHAIEALDREAAETAAAALR